MLFELLSRATVVLFRPLIIACPVLLCIDLACGNELIVLRDVEGGSNMGSEEMLVARLIELAI